MLYYNNKSFEQKIHFSAKKKRNPLTGEVEIIPALKFVPIKLTHLRQAPFQ